MIYEYLVDEDPWLSESEKPRYLLPDGCMDLNDVIRRQERDATIGEQRAAISDALEKLVNSMAAKDPTNDLAQLSGAMAKHVSALFKGLPLCITIPDPVSVVDLASMLHLKPYQLIAILLQFDVFASATSEVSFATAGDACALLGVEVKKAAGS